MSSENIYFAMQTDSVAFLILFPSKSNIPDHISTFITSSHSVSETHAGDILWRIWHVRTNREAITEIKSTEISLSPCELELYYFARQVDQHFNLTNVPAHSTNGPLPGENVLISRPGYVCALLKPSDTCDTRCSINICCLIVAHFRLVDEFNLDREGLILVQYKDVLSLSSSDNKPLHDMENWYSIPKSIFIWPEIASGPPFGKTLRWY